MILTCFDLFCNRYDRKDPSVVAVSVSPEESLLLGFFGFFFFLKNYPIFEVCTALTSLRYAMTNVMLEWDNQG